jgi:hypothetical protein
MGPFRVVLICLDDHFDNDHGEEEARVFVYSSKTCKWSQRAILQVPLCSIDERPVVLVAEAFYSLAIGHARRVLKYDLGDNSLSVLNLPPVVADTSQWIPPVLVTAADGGLGLANLDMFTLHMWCYDDGVSEWTRHRVIDLSTHLPVGDPMIAPQVAGSVEGTRTIFVVTDFGTYMIDLDSLPSRKEDDILKPLSRKLCSNSKVGETVIFHVFPYFSFFNRPGMYPLKTLAVAPILFNLPVLYFISGT